MLTNQDRNYALKRKRMWDLFGWGYSGIGYLSQNHSLNCGCGMCHVKTYLRRKKNKQDRREWKKNLKGICDHDEM